MDQPSSSLKIVSWPLNSNEEALNAFKDLGLLSCFAEERKDAPDRTEGTCKVWREGSTFFSEGVVHCDQLTLLALVKESDLGSLAGALTRWQVTSHTPFSDSLFYTSCLPWPFNRRWFSIHQTVAIDSSSDILFVGFDNNLPDTTKDINDVQGHVLFSFYRIKKISEKSSLLRRAININLDTYIPDYILNSSLIDNYLNDLINLKTASCNLPKELIDRIEKKEIYQTVKKLL